MKVFAYYEPVPELSDHAALVSRWSDRWRRMGWQPVVLGYDHDALRHPSHDRVVSLVQQFPGVTPIGYRVATFRRWLALAVSLPLDEVALVCDYDVFNVSLTPDEGLRLHDKAAIHNLHYGQCCQPLVLDGRQAQALPWLATTQLLRAWFDFQGKMEPHDDHLVHMLRRPEHRVEEFGPFKWTDLCYAYGPGPAKGKLVHLAFGPTTAAGETKLTAWAKLEEAYPCA